MPFPEQQGPTGVPVLAADPIEGIRVFVTGGTSTTVFSGSINATISNVKLIDDLGNKAEIPAAGDAKTDANHAMLVQHVDQYGRVLTQATQVQIMNTAGTLANSVLQGQVVAASTAAMNNQGTLATQVSAGQASAALTRIMNDQGTLATQATLGQVSSTLTAILNAQGTQAASVGYATDATASKMMNNQGTLATSALQQTVSTLTGLIHNNQGTLATELTQAEVVARLDTLVATLQAQGTNLEATLFSARTTSGDSLAVNVSGYEHHTVQHVINGNVTVLTKTSLDGVNWHVEATNTASTLFRLTGAAKYVQATYATGSGTLTTLLNSVRGSGGGGAVNGSGPAESSFSTTFSAAFNSTYVLPTNGAASIGLHISPPAGCVVQFEGSWDGVEYSDITLRQMGSDGYGKTCSAHDDWIGSVASFNYFRLRVIQGAAGEVETHGRFSYMLCTLEGVEHGPMPHRFGVETEVRNFSFSAITSNGTIFAPTNPQRRLAVTDLVFTVEGATSQITFSDGSLADNQFVFKGRVNPPAGGCIVIPIAFATPHVFSGTNRALRFTQSAGANVDGVIHCYETE